MKKIPKDDRRAKHMSISSVVDEAGLIEFVTGKNRWGLVDNQERWPTSDEHGHWNRHP